MAILTQSLKHGGNLDPVKRYLWVRSIRSHFRWAGPMYLFMGVGLLLWLIAHIIHHIVN